MKRPRKEDGMTQCSATTLTTDDAIGFVRNVKQALPRDQYQTFLDAMRDFKANKINIFTVVKTVKGVLKGRLDLLRGFNVFLPKSIKITVREPQDEENEDENDPGRLDQEMNDQAIAFINKIKDRFAQHEGRVYESFLELLCSFKERKVNASSIYREVAVLFQDNEDLLEEFKHFLPEQG